MALNLIAVGVLQSTIIFKSRSSWIYITATSSIGSFPVLSYFLMCFFGRGFSSTNAFNCSCCQIRQVFNTQCHLYITNFYPENWFIVFSITFFVWTQFLAYVSELMLIILYLLKKLYFLIPCISNTFSDIFLVFN